MIDELDMNLVGFIAGSRSVGSAADLDVNP